jgi:hypothetical protein
VIQIEKSAHEPNPARCSDFSIITSAKALSQDVWRADPLDDTPAPVVRSTAINQLAKSAPAGPGKGGSLELDIGGLD